MKSFFQALNKPIEAFRSENKWAAWGLVAITILINTVFEPLLRAFSQTGNYEIKVFHMLITTASGICTYITICVLFWFTAKCLGSKTNISTFIATWGLTYFPTLLCSLIVAFTEVYFYVFWNSIIWGMVFNILFVGILLWKVILYVIYLREIAELRGGRMISAFIIIGIFIILLAMANGYIGLKTPIL